MKLYIWGSQDEVGKFDPESIALFIYLILNDPQKKVQIVSSYNAEFKLAFANKFPFLISENPNGNGDVCVTQGYYKIIRFLNKKDDKGNKIVLLLLDTPEDDSLINHALISFMTNEFKLLNYYCYFLNESNYFGYTLGLFKHYLPFVLSHYISSLLRKQIKQESEVIGVYSDLVDASNEELALCKLHSELNKASKKSLKELKKLTVDHRIINLTRQYMGRLHIQTSNSVLLSLLNDYTNTESSPKLGSSNQPQGFQDQSKVKNAVESSQGASVPLSEVDILLISYVICLINNQLPENLLIAEFTSKYSTLVKLANKFNSQLYF